MTIPEILQAFTNFLIDAGLLPYIQAGLVVVLIVGGVGAIKDLRD